MTIKVTLERAKLANTLVSIYVDPTEWGSFSVGYVDRVTDTHVRLRALSRHGEPAGFEIRPLSEIFKIDIGGKYEKKIERLSRNQGKVFKEVEPRRNATDDLIRDSLAQSKEESVVIVIWGRDPDDSLVGYVEQLDSEVVSLRLIDEFGEDDGVSVMDIDEITSIDFNTKPEQLRRFLSSAD